jgi:hypothetical protein
MFVANNDLMAFILNSAPREPLEVFNLPERIFNGVNEQNAENKAICLVKPRIGERIPNDLRIGDVVWMGGCECRVTKIGEDLPDNVIQLTATDPEKIKPGYQDFSRPKEFKLYPMMQWTAQQDAQWKAIVLMIQHAELRANPVNAIGLAVDIVIQNANWWSQAAESGKTSVTASGQEYTSLEIQYELEVAKEYLDAVQPLADLVREHDLKSPMSLELFQAEMAKHRFNQIAIALGLESAADKAAIESLPPLQQQEILNRLIEKLNAAQQPPSTKGIDKKPEEVMPEGKENDESRTGSKPEDPSTNSVGLSSESSPVEEPSVLQKPIKRP